MNEFVGKNTAWFQLYALTRNAKFLAEIKALRQLLGELDKPFPTSAFTTQLQKKKWISWLDKEFKTRRKTFTNVHERSLLHEKHDDSITKENLKDGWHLLPRINKHLESIASKYGFLPFSTQRKMLLEHYFYQNELPVITEKPTILKSEKQPDGSIISKLKLTKYTQLSDIKNNKSWKRIEWILSGLTKSDKPFSLIVSEENGEQCCYLQLFRNTTKSDIVKNWKKIGEFKKKYLGHANKLSTRKQFDMQLEIYKKYLQLVNEDPQRKEVFKTMYNLDELSHCFDFFKKSRRSIESGIEYADLRKMIAEMKKILPPNLRII